MKTKNLFQLGSFALLISFLTYACIDLDNIDDIEIIQNDAEYAIPLVSSTINLETVLTENFEFANVSYDENDVAVVHYESDIVKKSANEIFKPIVFPAPIPFVDTLIQLAFDEIEDYDVDRGTIRGDSMRFGFTSEFDEDITVSVGIREAFKDGDSFTHKYTITPNSDFLSPMLSLRGYDFESPENVFSFFYDARKANGERVELTDGYFEFTYLVFEYIEGYLGKSVQDLSEKNIEVNVFDLWESGVLEFEDPKITIRLDNAFGFPVMAVVNHFTITNLSGEVIELESELFGQDIIFDYPALDEVGEVKSSEFVFDKHNSNFGTAFNQKVTNVSYDVDALVNPDEDASQIGFYVFDSYYNLNVSVDLPMRFRADDLKLKDNFEIPDLPEQLDLVESIEFKTYITNLFPVNVRTQIYLLDESYTPIDSIFEDGPQFFPAGIVQPDGTVLPGQNSQPFYITYDAERKERFNKATRLAPHVILDSGQSDDWVEITRNQGLDLKVGVKFKLN